jgi:hypothetical protein
MKEIKHRKVPSTTYGKMSIKQKGEGGIQGYKIFFIPHSIPYAHTY